MTNLSAVDPPTKPAVSARRRLSFWLSVVAGIGFAVLAVALEPPWTRAAFGLAAVSQLVRAVTLRPSVSHR